MATFKHISSKNADYGAAEQYLTCLLYTSSRGMVVDFAVHQPDREDGGIPNPHFHVLCPIRPIEQKMCIRDRTRTVLC